MQEATKVFADGLDVLAALVGIELDERTCTVEFAHATEELDIPGMVVPEGHVAGMDVNWHGIVDGVTRLTIHLRWVIGDKIEPPWGVEFGYVVEVAGDPNLRIKLDLWPDGDLSNLSVDDMRNIGTRITAIAGGQRRPRRVRGGARDPHLRRAHAGHHLDGLTTVAAGARSGAGVGAQPVAERLAGVEDVGLGDRAGRGGVARARWRRAARRARARLRCSCSGKSSK